MHQASGQVQPNKPINASPADPSDAGTESSKEATPPKSCITDGHKFEPLDLNTATTPDSGLPPELWTIVQSVHADFAPKYFLDVSRNLLENPNLTASYLSRAELSYQSFADATYNPNATDSQSLAYMVRHLKPDHQPRLLQGGLAGYKLEWTVVRKLIPRNPNLDAALVQTCHLFSSKVTTSGPGGNVGTGSETERYLIVYIPHASDPEQIPFYHPKVRGVAILYSFQHESAEDTAAGRLSIFFDLYPQMPLDNRMSRTALRMLQIIHKHSRGLERGYQKRVHHDMIIPQKTFQDTYAYLKGKYAKDLIHGWVEQTPPEKHVFEDLGIAAFLIELWTDMYGVDATKEGHGTQADPRSSGETRLDQELTTEHAKKRRKAQETFPSFIDIGCGNGLLVYILKKEGWQGWGFDARKRKTWSTFESQYQEILKEMLLIPEPLEAPDSSASAAGLPYASHNGLVPPGTFIISNHADELTAWTPLLAYISSSPFIAIPCCSHDFGGTRFRAPYREGHMPFKEASSSKKQVSAYASLCSFVADLAVQVGYVPEKEHLRIPSTRNLAIVGRNRVADGADPPNKEERIAFVKELVEQEMGSATSIEQVRMQWIARGDSLQKPGKGPGH